MYAHYMHMCVVRNHLFLSIFKGREIFNLEGERGASGAAALGSGVAQD